MLKRACVEKKICNAVDAARFKLCLSLVIRFCSFWNNLRQTPLRARAADGTWHEVTERLLGSRVREISAGVAPCSRSR